MKARCPYCGRLVRIVATATPTPRLVKHQAPRTLAVALDRYAKAECYGSLEPTHNVHRAVQRMYRAVGLELAET